MLDMGFIENPTEVLQINNIKYSKLELLCVCSFFELDERCRREK
jgi:hypothetical protein